MQKPPPPEHVIAKHTCIVLTGHLQSRKRAQTWTLCKKKKTPKKKTIKSTGAGEESGVGGGVAVLNAVRPYVTAFYSSQGGEGEVIAFTMTSNNNHRKF